MRSFLYAIAFGAFVTTAAASTVPAAALKGWNVVLITLDTTNPARLATYGGDPRVMPFLDALAAKGLVVENAYATTGSTAPSHATMLSGALPHEHGVLYNGGGRLAAGRWWMPEELAKRGYFTAGSTVAFFMGKDYGFGRGWSLFTSATVAQTPVPSNDASVGLASPQLDAVAAAGKPFFAWVHLKGGHDPLVPIGSRFLRNFSPRGSTAIAPKKPAADDLMSSAERASAMRELLRYYDANLLEADDALRKLMEGFKKRGLSARTLFVITADHGESFDHGIVGEHWPSPWQSTLRIPMILYTESGTLPKGRLRDRLVSTADLAPTIMHLLGFPGVYTGREGKNMFGPDARQSMAAASVSSLLYEDYEARAVKLAGDKEGVAAMQQLRADAAELERTGIFYWAYIKRVPDGSIYKIVHFGNRRNTAGAGGVQMYNVTRDPRETSDLVSKGEERRLAVSLLNEARARSPFFGRLGTLTGDNARMMEGLDAEAIRKLKALGYLQ